MNRKNLFILVLISVAIFAFGCQRSPFQNQTITTAPASLRDVPALKLNYRFESDVPAPAVVNQQNMAEEKNGAIQNDFDVNRPQEILEKTFTSPDKQRVVAVYRKAEDNPLDFRLDMYSPDGKLVRKITPNGMAVRFPDTVVWSPDSNNIAFVGVIRSAGQVSPTPTPAANTDSAEPNANTEVDTNSDINANAAQPSPAQEQAQNVLTFRTEQIYLSNKEGSDLKPLTQNEGLKYFYFVWAPDSSALACLAATWREWQVGQAQAGQRGEAFIPAGRPRVVERNGRERRLDDNVTAVQPVWSPDSSKVADAFDKEVRVYDAIGDSPTQAAIPLRNQLLLSSKAYDEQKKLETEAAGNSNTNAETNVNSNTNIAANSNANANINALPTPPTSTDTSTLPDENTLVSFNPIIELRWSEDSILYIRTGFVREMQNQVDSVHSFMRWHRLILSPQATALN